MEALASFALPAALCAVLLRLLYAPAKWFIRLALHALGGLVCLWLLNTVSGFTGLTLSINGVTVLLCGALGLPGTALVILLEML